MNARPRGVSLGPSLDERVRFGIAAA